MNDKINKPNAGSRNAKNINRQAGRNNNNNAFNKNSLSNSGKDELGLKGNTPNNSLINRQSSPNNSNNSKNSTNSDKNKHETLNTEEKNKIEDTADKQDKKDKKNKKGHKISTLAFLLDGDYSSLSAAAKTLIQKKIMLLIGSLGCGTFALLCGFIVIVTTLAICLDLISSSGNDNNNSNVAIGGECGFTISSTPLSKDEYINKVNEYAKTHAKASGLADHAGEIYDKAKSMNLNPELVFIRAAAEGYSPGGSTYNYYGMGCTNTGGIKACKTYSSVMEGVEAYLKNISQYDSLSGMMSRYSYIGDYWYNPGSAGKGGCYYAYEIYNESNIPSRVATACKKGNTCSGSSCTETTEADQQAYATYQVEVYMAGFRQDIFGLSGSTKCTGSTSDGNLSLALFVTNGEQLKSNLSDFLSSNGTDLNSYNQFIYNKVKEAGYGTKNGAVTAALALFKYLDQYGYRPRYYFGGKYSGYGVPSTLGDEKGSLDCSGFISWALHNGGYKYFSYGSGEWGSAGTKCDRTSESCVGKTGDLIWHSGHIMMIVGVENGYYYIAEAASTNSGMRIKKEAMHIKKADKIVDMTSFYNNESNKETVET